MPPQPPRLVHTTWATPFDGYVRTVQVLDETRVRVEYELDMVDEGGVSYECVYPDEDALVQSVASFTGLAREDWGVRDVSARQLSPAIAEGNRKLREAIEKGVVPLPAGCTCRMRGSDYWKRIEPMSGRPV